MGYLLETWPSPPLGDFLVLVHHSANQHDVHLQRAAKAAPGAHRMTGPSEMGVQHSQYVDLDGVPSRYFNWCAELEG